MEQLCTLEEKLWGEQTFEYTYALAAQVHVAYQLVKDPETQQHVKRKEAHARQLVKTMLATTKTSPARTFLQVAEVVPNNTTADEAMHWWIHLFLMHRNNPENEQLEMVRYIHRETVANGPKLGSIATQILNSAVSPQ